MQRPAEFPTIEFVPGDHVTFTITLKNAAGALIDLTGYTAAAQVRAISGGDSDPLLASFVIVNEPLDTDGSIQLRLTNVSTASLKGKKNLAWDLQTTTPGGIVRTVVSGQLRPLPDVTQ
jgi:hypothetical protein